LLQAGCGDDSGATRERRSAAGARPGGEDQDLAAFHASFVQLEAERRALDETVWEQEMEALRLEQPFIDLWDRIRRSGETWSALAEFGHGEVILGSLGPWAVGESDIEIASGEAVSESIAAADFKRRLDAWRDAGYRIDQIELRQARYQPGAPRYSEFEFAAHLQRAEPHERVVARGRFNVRWSDDLAEEESAVPASITVTTFELLRRRGEPAFALGLTTELHPPGDGPFADPLIVRDIDGDGNAEIILPCAGLLFRNRGEGRFAREPLGLTQRVNTAVVEDFDGDGLDDLLGADHSGLLCFRGTREGGFNPQGQRVWTAPESLPNPYVMAVGDIDGDGDLDAWLAQYKLPYVAGQMPTPYYDANDGFPGFLLVNLGSASFKDATESAGLAGKRLRRAYGCSFVDLDHDGDLDLLVTSDFAGIDLHLNDGNGRFEDVTDAKFDDRHLFGMAHGLGDFDLDGALDLLAIGMNLYSAERMDHLNLGPPMEPHVSAMRTRMAYGNRLYFGRNGVWAQTEMSHGIARTGWSWGVTSLDFDLDGDLDVYITNGHKSRETARDYESQFWRHDIFVATSEPDPVKDYYFQSVARRLYGAGYSYGGYEKNRLYLNASGKSFLEAGYLMGVSMERDCRNVVSEDLDGDGAPDLIVMTYEEWPRKRHTLNLFRNVWTNRGNWIGVRLQSTTQARVTGAQVAITYDGKSQTRHFVTGDSHRSQHSASALFGLGSHRQVDEMEIRWADGNSQRIERPNAGRYHVVEGP
jgi:hypothetical protein